MSTMMVALAAFGYDMNRWGEMSGAERDTFYPVSKSLVGVLLAALVLVALAVQSVISGTRQT